jgi:MFS superfamily sulfate permease-like transporter
MGYTRIAGTPVVTGLYTILLPIAAFAILGSSRHLVVGADSATAAILFSGLIGLARPESPEWLALASTAALMTAAFLFLARILRLGFLADFLSRTVLVGFLSGVGISLLVGEVPHMLGVPVKGDGFVDQLLAVGGALPATHLPTLLLALAVLAVILGCGRLAPRVPGALLAVALAIAATWAFGLDRYGIAVAGRVEAGLPTVRIPRVALTDVRHLVTTSLSMFLVIVAQSAATARGFAQKYNEPLDEDRDLVALGVANLAAGLSSTFVVNGSPTKTAVVDAAGGRTQFAQLTTAGVVLAVLLFATGLIARLPDAALAALVFLIGVRLVHLRGLRQIYHFRKWTFAVSVGTLLGVTLLGVERGILVAIALSVLDHLRQEYHPKDVVLTEANGHARARKAAPGLETEPGLLVYRFEAPLFFANADYFRARLKHLITAAPHPTRWVVLDMVSMDDIDYTAGLMLQELIARLQHGGITLACAQAEDVRAILDRLGITRQVGEDHLFPTPQVAIDAFRQAAGGVQRGAAAQAVDAPPPGPGPPTRDT